MQGSKKKEKEEMNKEEEVEEEYLWKELNFKIDKAKINGKGRKVQAPWSHPFLLNNF